jgi:hypothetical protein
MKSRAEVARTRQKSSRLLPAVELSDAGFDQGFGVDWMKHV